MPVILMKRYVGDGVYAEMTEQGLILTTENGLWVTNRIVLEPTVWRQTQEFVKGAQMAPKREAR